MVDLRRRILRTPLGIGFRDEELLADNNDIHIAAYWDDELAGCLVFTSINDEIVKMRQVAVEEKYQGMGIGKSMIRFSEGVAKSRGYHTITLHARSSVAPFYRKLGYNFTGEAFEEVTLLHYCMVRNL